MSIEKESHGFLALIPDFPQHPPSCLMDQVIMMVPQQFLADLQDIVEFAPLDQRDIWPPLRSLFPKVFGSHKFVHDLARLGMIDRVNA